MWHLQLDILTPIWTSDDGVVTNPTCRITRDAEICKLHAAILIGEYVRSLDVSMDNALIMQIDKAFQNLGDIHSYEVLWKFPEAFADVVERTVLTEPSRSENASSAQNTQLTLGLCTDIRVFSQILCTSRCLRAMRRVLYAH